jgi:hypothetical protein
MKPRNPHASRWSYLLMLIALFTLNGCDFLNKLLHKSPASAPPAAANNDGKCLVSQGRAVAAAAPVEYGPRNCDSASVSQAVRTVFNKDVETGSEVSRESSQLGPVDVEVKLFNTADKYAADPAEYFAAYNYEQVSVSLLLSNGETIGGLGASVDEAINAAHQSCVGGEK